VRSRSTHRIRHVFIVCKSACVTSVYTPYLDEYLQVLSDAPRTFHCLLQSAAERSVLHHGIDEKTAFPLVLIYMLLWHTTYTNSVPCEVVTNDGICICGMSARSVAVICLPDWTTAVFNTVRITLCGQTARSVFFKDVCSGTLEIYIHWYTLLCVIQLC
jgi:hypothetical protein